MANVLYLVHRLPYPPNKGDKVRSWHLLKHLASRHRVFLGTFVDDAEDWVHVAHLRTLCVEVHAAALAPRAARVFSLAALATGEPLTLRYYRDTELQRWVRALARRESLDAAVVFSSSMAPYAEALSELPTLVDFVDVDSAKWRAYASQRPWPLSWLYRLEGRRLLSFESATAARAQRSFFVTEKEVALFRSLVPGCAERVEAVGNGVDADHFGPDASRASPFEVDEKAIVFTGAMDYWPNVDAVCWFAREILPVLCRSRPGLRFFIVGRSPGAAVQRLASDSIVVTGTVSDVRPYLQHAAVVVAPMRLARGVQNKILEAMAMARPVVAADECARALEVEPGLELLVAGNARAFVQQVESLLASPARAQAIGEAARRCVLARYSWPARLAPIDACLSAAIRARPIPMGATAGSAAA